MRGCPSTLAAVSVNGPLLYASTALAAIATVFVLDRSCLRDSVSSVADLAMRECESSPRSPVPGDHVCKPKDWTAGRIGKLSYALRNCHCLTHCSCCCVRVVVSAAPPWCSWRLLDCTKPTNSPSLDIHVLSQYISSLDSPVREVRYKNNGACISLPSTVSGKLERAAKVLLLRGKRNYRQ